MLTGAKAFITFKEVLRCPKDQVIFNCSRAQNNRNHTIMYLQEIPLQWMLLVRGGWSAWEELFCPRDISVVTECKCRIWTWDGSFQWDFCETSQLYSKRELLKGNWYVRCWALKIWDIAITNVCWTKSIEIAIDRLQLKHICSHPSLVSINILSCMNIEERSWTEITK